jgi:hypothetical protein
MTKVVVGLVLSLSIVTSLAYHASALRMIPPTKEAEPIKFNPVHFSILCLTLLALRVCHLEI